MTEETAQIAECYYLNKICDKNMIQINQPPVQIEFNFHDIPELDLECVDETEIADVQKSDAKNFIQTKNFDLHKFYKNSFLMCSYESGSIVGSP